MIDTTESTKATALIQAESRKRTLKLIARFI